MTYIVQLAPISHVFNQLNEVLSLSIYNTNNVDLFTATLGHFLENIIHFQWCVVFEQVFQ
jgi:hypothetical protein